MQKGGWPHSGTAMIGHSPLNRAPWWWWWTGDLLFSIFNNTLILVYSLMFIIYQPTRCCSYRTCKVITRLQFQPGPSGSIRGPVRSSRLRQFSNPKPKRDYVNSTCLLWSGVDQIQSCPISRQSLETDAMCRVRLTLCTNGRQ